MRHARRILIDTLIASVSASIASTVAVLLTT